MALQAGAEATRGPVQGSDTDELRARLSLRGHLLVPTAPQRKRPVTADGARFQLHGERGLATQRARWRLRVMTLLRVLHSARGSRFDCADRTHTAERAVLVPARPVLRPERRAPRLRTASWYLPGICHRSRERSKE